MQTQTSSALYNSIMEAGGKDRPLMLAPGNYVQWKSIIKRYIDTKPNHELIHFCLKSPPYQYKFLTTYANTIPITPSKKKLFIAEAEVVKIIFTGIDNDIYSTVDACPNEMNMWKAIEWLKQGNSINIQDLETNLYWEFGKFTSQEGGSLESYYLSFYKMISVYCHQSSSECPILTSTKTRMAEVCEHKPKVVVDDDASLKEKEIDKLMALILISFKKIYKPTNNNLKTSSNTRNLNIDNTLRSNKGTWHVARECQKPKRAKDSAYHKEKMLMYQELEVHYMFTAKIQEVTLDAADNYGPIFDDEPLQKVHNSDDECHTPKMDRSGI
ncbi:hypothetical protein Tco_1262616, partial [Tanacetum coccineum]